MNCRIFFAAAFSLCGLVHGENLVPNPGFESGRADAPAGWKLSRKGAGDAHVAEGVSASGKRSLKLRVAREPGSEAEVVMSAQTDLIPSPAPGAELRFSFRAKSERMTATGKWNRARQMLVFFNEDKRRLKHFEMSTPEGAFDWRTFSGDFVAPENAAFMQVVFSLQNCQGDLWVDDVELSAREPAARFEKVAASLDGRSAALVPRPVEVSDKNYKISFNEIALKTMPGDDRFNEALNDVLSGKKISLKEPEADEERDKQLLIVCGDSTVGHVAKAFEREFGDRKWRDMGPQGYFIVIKDAAKEKRGILGALDWSDPRVDGRSKLVIIGADTERGRFHAAQTLRQLLGVSNELAAASIFDRPSVETRGVVIGNQWLARKEEVVLKAARMKMNCIWNQGSFMNLKLGYSSYTLKAHWREPFERAETRKLREYSDLCYKNFIDAHMTITPCGTPPTCYSSEEDVDALCAKIESLYNAGVKNVSINFEDLRAIGQDKLTDRRDREKFGDDLGKAHVYFLESVARKMAARCPGLGLGVIPCSGQRVANLSQKDRDYMRTLGGLPGSIRNWAVYASSPSEIAAAASLAGRKPFVWDDFYADRKLPPFPPPPSREGAVGDQSVSGYAFIPPTPQDEDASAVSWMNAADYEWNPAKYNPADSLARAVALAAGGRDAVEAIKKYGAASVRFEAGDFPNGSREKRVEGIRNFLRDLNALIPDVKKTPEKISSELSKNIKKYYDELESAQAEIQRKPYPLKVASSERSPGNPGGLADKFALLRGGVAAPVDTKAWFTHDDRSLLVKVDCSEPDLKNILSARDERETGARDESIDLFILPDGSSEYHKISARISGAVTRERLPLGRADKSPDESAAARADDVACKVTKGDDSWTVELAVPKKSLGLGGKPSGEKMYFNIVRNRNCSKEPAQYTFAPLWRRSLKTPFVFWAAELE